MPSANATTPMTRILSVCQLRKASAVAVAPTEMPRKTVTMFISSFCTVLLRRSTTPHSRMRLPSIRLPISGAAEGSSRETKIVTMMGKMIFSVLLTSRSCFISIWRSFLVVSSFMMGGWMTGTSAIYE